MKSCAILQPHYLPWVGYFEMIDRVDVFVFLDDVQFIKREWKNRNRIRKTHNHAEGKWLSVPVNRADQHGLLTEAHLFTGEDWAAGHLNAIRDTYGRSPFFADVFPLLKTALRGVRDTVLSELNIGLIDALCCILGITTERIKVPTWVFRESAKRSF